MGMAKRQAGVKKQEVDTPKGLLEDVQKAMEGVDLLYERIPKPYARDAHRRTHVRSTLEAVQSLLADDEVTSASKRTEIPAEIPVPDDLASEHVMELMKEAGYTTIESIEAATDGELLKIDGIGPSTLKGIRTEIEQYRKDEA